MPDLIDPTPPGTCTGVNAMGKRPPPPPHPPPRSVPPRIYIPTVWEPPRRDIYDTPTGQPPPWRDIQGAKIFHKWKIGGGPWPIFRCRAQRFQTPPRMPTGTGGGRREGTSAQEGWDPSGRPPFAPGGRPDASFHWSGASTQLLGPYPSWNARIGAKGGTPGKFWAAGLISHLPYWTFLGGRGHMSPRWCATGGGGIPRPPPPPYPPRLPPPPPQPPGRGGPVSHHPYPPTQGIVPGGWGPQGGFGHPMGLPLATRLESLGISDATIHAFAAAL